MTRKTAEAFFFVLVVAIGCLSVDSWLASRDAQRTFKATFAAEEGVLAKSDAAKRKQENDLTSVLKQIEKLKKKTRTPSQIVKELPRYLPLPAPISIARPQQSDCVKDSRDAAGTQVRAMDNESQSLTDSVISQYKPSVAAQPSPVSADELDAKLPLQDLKPLFNFVQDCRTCDAELEAARNAAKNNSIKIATLTRERDLALRAEKGSLWHRLRHGVVLFSFGAMVGYVAAHR